MSKDLRNLCIYDLCDDPAILKKILVVVESREDYLEECRQSPPAKIPLDMLDYADFIGDLSLREEILKVWGDEIDAYFNE